MKKLAIIPAYNEGENIKGTVCDILKNAPDFDYIVINDCSTDNTAQVCRENNFNYISHPVNLGIGNTVQTGYIYAYRNGYDIAVQGDGDGQSICMRWLNILLKIILIWSLVQGLLIRKDSSRRRLEDLALITSPV